MIEKIAAIRRYQILKPVILVEFVRSKSIEILHDRKIPGIIQGEKNQIRKLQLRMKIGTAPNRGGA